jgi:hypothetical protein
MDFYDDFDPNLYLPSFFITCFDEHQLPLYHEAIKFFAELHPQHQLVIDLSGIWNPTNDPALLCFEGGDLSEFWNIYNTLMDSQ